MRRFRFLAISAVATLLVACGKDDFSKVIETSSKIEGRYECVSALWYGRSVDLNNDGVSSNDLFAEFDHMSNSLSALGSQAMVITGVEDTEHEGRVSISFPMQYIRENKSDGHLSFANPLGGTAWYEISYTIDKDGKVIWQEPASISDPEQYVIDDVHYRDGIDYLRTGRADVQYFIDGQFFIIFDLTYYDWSSSSWIAGKVEMRYRRRAPLMY